MQVRSTQTMGPVSEETRAALREWLDEVGETVVVARVGLSRMGIYRALAGLTVHAGSRALLDRALAARASEVA